MEGARELGCDVRSNQIESRVISYMRTFQRHLALALHFGGVVILKKEQKQSERWSWTGVVGQQLISM